MSPSGATDYPTLGAGGIFGYTYLPPGQTPILFTSAPITVPTTTTTTPFISCTHYDADPDGGVTSAYCVCSSSTFSESVDTSVTPADSCAYTTLPGSTIPPPIQTIVTTESSICSVCTFVGQSETCTSIPKCTVTPTTTSSTAYPTNTAENVGSAYFYTSSNGPYLSFTQTDAQNVVQDFCNNNWVLTPGGTGFSQPYEATG